MDGGSIPFTSLCEWDLSTGLNLIIYYSYLECQLSYKSRFGFIKITLLKIYLTAAENEVSTYDTFCLLLGRIISLSRLVYTTFPSGKLIL